jgi:hypothetical protein
MPTVRAVFPKRILQSGRYLRDLLLGNRLMAELGFFDKSFPAFAGLRKSRGPVLSDPVNWGLASVDFSTGCA